MSRACSIFAQILQLFPRSEFQEAVKVHSAERHARGFSSWGQFIAMLFLPAGSRQIATRDLWRTGGQRRQITASGIAGSAVSLNAGLCQRAPALAAVPDRISSVAEPLP